METEKNGTAWAVAIVVLIVALVGGVFLYQTTRGEDQGRACAELILDGGTADDC